MEVDEAAVEATPNNNDDDLRRVTVHRFPPGTSRGLDPRDVPLPPSSTASSSSTLADSSSSTTTVTTSSTESDEAAEYPSWLSSTNTSGLSMQLSRMAIVEQGRGGARPKTSRNTRSTRRP